MRRFLKRSQENFPFTPTSRSRPPFPPPQEIQSAKRIALPLSPPVCPREALSPLSSAAGPGNETVLFLFLFFPREELLWRNCFPCSFYLLHCRPFSLVHEGLRQVGNAWEKENK